MSVIDASAAVELLLGTATGRSIAGRIADPSADLHAPHLLDVEVAQVLRHYIRDGDLSPTDAVTALDNLRALDIERHGHAELLDRVWTLRHNLTAYDAVYVALAEALNTKVLTCDRRLSRAPGLSRRFVLVAEE